MLMSMKSGNNSISQVTCSFSMASTESNSSVESRLTSTAAYQALIGQIPSPICPHGESEEETAKHLLLFYPKWAVERQH